MYIFDYAKFHYKGGHPEGFRHALRKGNFRGRLVSDVSNVVHVYNLVVQSC